MLGSQFVRQFANKGPFAWEAAALQVARDGGLVPWPTFDLTLATPDGHAATVPVAIDVLAVGTIEDHVRLPLTPSAAQSILNLSGALLPTPWLAYQIWRQAPVKIRPIAMIPNLGANLLQYAQHDALVDDALSIVGRGPSDAAVGIGKDVVVSNEYRPGKVVIFGWWRPEAPDVFDDGSPMTTPGRQPLQPLSNIHGEGYVDYSHGIRAVGPVATVDGQPMGTAELYRHPTLSRLVSNEGPVRAIRYPSPVTPTTNLPPPVAAEGTSVKLARDVPSAADLGFAMMTRSDRNGRR